MDGKVSFEDLDNLMHYYTYAQQITNNAEEDYRRGVNDFLSYEIDKSKNGIIEIRPFQFIIEDSDYYMRRKVTHAMKIDGSEFVYFTDENQKEICSTDNCDLYDLEWVINGFKTNKK